MQSGSFRSLFLLVALLFLGQALIAQENADAIYTALDRYLADPSDKERIKLETSIEKYSDSAQTTLLAKSIAYCNMGFIENQKGRLSDAIRFYQQCTHLYQSQGLSGYAIIEYGLKPLGNLYTKVQAFAEAENTIKDYLLLAQKEGDRAQEIAAILNLTTLYHSSGQYNRAKILLEEALGNLPKNQQLQLNLAYIHFALGEWEEARTALEKYFENSGNTPEAFQLMAQLYLKENRYREAIEVLEKTLAEFREDLNLREIAKIHLQLAEVFYTKGDNENTYAQVRQVYAFLVPFFQPEQRYPNREEIYGETLLMDALDLHAAIALEEEGGQASLAIYELAQLANDYLYDDLYTQESKLLLQQDTKVRAERSLAILADLFEVEKRDKWVELALKIDAKAKGRTASEAAQRKAFLNEKYGLEFAQFSEQQNRLYEIRRQLQNHGQTSLSTVQLKALQEEYSKVLAAVQLQFQELQKIKEDGGEELTLRKIGQNAGKNVEIVVSYFLGTKAVYQITVSDEQKNLKHLVQSEREVAHFKEAIRQYSRLFERPDPINNDLESFKKRSYALYQSLEIPKGSENLVIIPDGILSFIPFQSLLTSPTDQNQFEDMPFLLFHKKVSYRTSVADYLASSSPLAENPSVLGVFPVFRGTPEELSYSLSEANALEKNAKSDLLMEEEGKADVFLDRAADYTILHLSSHALGGDFHEEAKLQFSDRILKVSELYHHYLPSQLVVLSACDTGIGRLVKGEGALSLARGFHYAGSPNLLFSLWEVNDKSTSELMGFYYENLKTYHSRDFALHQAKQDYLHDKNISNTRKSPYYWSAFVYYGTTDIPIPTEDHPLFVWIFLGVLPFLALLFIVLKLRRKN